MSVALLRDVFDHLARASWPSFAQSPFPPAPDPSDDDAIAEDGGAAYMNELIEAIQEARYIAEPLSLAAFLTTLLPTGLESVDFDEVVDPQGEEDYLLVTVTDPTVQVEIRIDFPDDDPQAPAIEWRLASRLGDEAMAAFLAKLSKAETGPLDEQAIRFANAIYAHARAEAHAVRIRCCEAAMSGG